MAQIGPMLETDVRLKPLPPTVRQFSPAHIDCLTLSLLGDLAVIRFYLIAAIVAILLATGCASPSSPEEGILHTDNPETLAAYKAQMEYVVSVVDATPNYERIPLDTKEQRSWFAGLTFKYWDEQIAREEFVKTSLARYPDYRASIELVADALKD